MELETRARDLLLSNEYINIATVSDAGEPWNTPVYAVVDPELRLYWSSWKDAEHSKNICLNSKVFISIYDSTRKRGDNNRRCLYLQGAANEVKDSDEIAKALKLLYGEESSTMNPIEFTADGLRRIYCAQPAAAWLNDKSERQVTKETVKMRIELSLDALKEMF